MSEVLAPIEYQTKIEKMEQELLKLKKVCFVLPKKIISLKGILKGIEVSDKEINKAKKSLFKKIEI